MSATSGKRAADPRVVRSQAAIVDAARTLFLREGYAGTTMDEIAALAGIAKRTVYNNFADKEALFRQIVEETIAFAEEFAHGLSDELTAGTTAANLRATLDALGRRLALAIVRPEVIALRRLLVGEAREFPALAARYFDKAPGQVLDALAVGVRAPRKVRIASRRGCAPGRRAVRLPPRGRAPRPCRAHGDDPAERARHRRRAGRGRDVPRSIPAAGQDPQRASRWKVIRNPGRPPSSIAASASRLSRSRERVRTARVCPALL